MTTLQKEVLTEGDGSSYAQNGATVRVAYAGWLSKGTMASQRGRRFDASAPGMPFEFVVGRGTVIKGWDEAVRQMSLGEKTVWKIPSELAYGKEGYPGLISPDADLIFEMELISIACNQTP